MFVPILSRFKSLSRRCSYQQLAGITFEFALVIPVLLFLVIGLLSIGLRYHGSSILSKGVEEGLDLAAVVQGLEDAGGPDHSNNDTLEERIRAEVIKFPERALFRLDNGLTIDGQTGTANSGTRITSVELNIGEDTLGAGQTDLTEYLKNNPIIITATAEVNNLLWFLPPWRVTVVQGAQREPVPGSTLPRIYHCDGTPLDFDQFGVTYEGNNCNCPGVDDPRVVLTPPSCSCRPNNPPYIHFDDNGNNEINAGECRCDPNLYNDDGTVCSCKQCIDGGPYHDVNYAVLVDGMPDCNCGCLAPLEDHEPNPNDYYVVCECPNPSQQLVDGACRCPDVPCQGQYNADTCVCTPCDQLNPPLAWNPDTQQCECQAECECDSASLTCDGIVLNASCQCLCPDGFDDWNPLAHTVNCQCPNNHHFVDGSCECSLTVDSCADQGKLFDEPNCRCRTCGQSGYGAGYVFDEGPPPVCICGIDSCPDGQYLDDNGTRCRCLGCPGEQQQNGEGTGCECPFADMQALTDHCLAQGELPDPNFAHCDCTPCPPNQEPDPDLLICVCALDDSDCPLSGSVNPNTCQCCPAGQVYDPDMQACGCPDCEPPVDPPYGGQNQYNCSCFYCEPPHTYEPDINTCSCTGGGGFLNFLYGEWIPCLARPGIYHFDTCQCEDCAQDYMLVDGTWEDGNSDLTNGTYGYCYCPADHCHESADLTSVGGDRNPSDCVCSCPDTYNPIWNCDGTGRLCCQPPGCGVNCTWQCLNGVCDWVNQEG
ncbi:MAG: pilus assembly protein [Bdellovibrionales bacterium]|nr:pilus assembly protein [Bdellovibrionales bacterium]